MATKTSTIKVTILGDADSATRALKQTEKAGQELADGTEKHAGKVSSAYGFLGGAIGGVITGTVLPSAVSWIGSLNDQGQALDSMKKKAQTVFGDQIGTVRQWADNNNEAFGLSKSGMLDLATSTADLLKPLGFTTDVATQLAEQSVTTAGALSAWTNGKYSAAEASDDLNKAMLGEYDGLKKYGIALSDADVKARMAADGTDQLTGAAFDQAKAQTIQQLINEKSTDAQKAWNDGTMDGVKAQNEIKAKMAETKETLASALHPAMAKITDLIVQQLIPAIGSLTSWLKDHKEVAIGLGVALAAMVVPPLVMMAASAIAAAAPFIALGLAIAGLVAGVIYAYNHFGWFKAAVDAVGAAIGWVYNWVKDNWPLLLAILTGPIGLAVYEINKHWQGIKDGVSGVKDWIVDKFNGVVDFVSGLPSRIWSVATGMFDGIKEAFRSALNWIIGRWNGLEFRVPSVSLGPFGSFGGFTLGVPDIPYLAAGGVVTRPTLAMVGEAGPEAVVPLRGRTGGLGATYNITVNVPHGTNARRTGRELQKYLNEYERAV